MCTGGGRGEGVVGEGRGTGGDENMAGGEEGGVYGKGNLVVDVAERGSRCSDHRHHRLVGRNVIQHFVFFFFCQRSLVSATRYQLPTREVLLLRKKENDNKKVRFRGSI